MAPESKIKFTLTTLDGLLQKLYSIKEVYEEYSLVFVFSSNFEIPIRYTKEYKKGRCIQKCICKNLPLYKK